MPDGFKGEIEKLKGVSVTVTGFESVQPHFDGDQIKVSVDVSSYMNYRNLDELEAGTYEMSAQVELPEGIQTKDDIKVAVKIS